MRDFMMDEAALMAAADREAAAARSARCRPSARCHMVLEALYGRRLEVVRERRMVDALGFEPRTSTG